MREPVHRSGRSPAIGMKRPEIFVLSGQPSKRFNGWQRMVRDEAERRVLRERLEFICEGLGEGVRREVAQLRALGLPVYVADGDDVVEAPAKPAAEGSEA